MAEVAPEIETKFDVAPDFAVPPLDALAGKHGHVDVDVVHLVSTYYDTEARDLLRQRLALRRRLGDADTGWQLKVPASEGRTELRWPPEGDEPPIEMLDLLGPFLRGHPLHPAVTVDTTRTRHRLVAEDGSMLAEIAADDVRAIDEGGGVRAPSMA
jgi:inorganic triphosphatase YgiF